MDLQIFISQCSVATQLRCGGIVTTLLQIFHTECAGAKILIIGQYNWRRYGQKFAASFLGHTVWGATMCVITTARFLPRDAL